MQKIAYFMQRWDTNIGNLFIDIGALISLSEAVGQESQILPVGTLNLWLEWLYLSKKISVFKPLLKPLVKLIGNDITNRVMMSRPSDRLNLAEIVELDYAIFSGCILTPLHIKTMEKSLKRLKNKGCNIILYAVGGMTYSNYEVKCVRQFLKNIKPKLLLTRDPITYKKYGDLAEISFDKLDAAFFVNRFSNQLKRFKLDIEPYIVLTFDDPRNRLIEKKLEKEFRERGFNVVKCSHNPYAKPSERFVSDSPFDYFLLYSHAEEIHTDRVHACVIGLSFGSKCRLYNDTPRASLLWKCCTGDISKEVCRPKDISNLQNEQLTILSQSLRG